MRRLFSLNSMVLVLLILALTSPAFTQERRLTIDLIYDPQQRLDFSGSPPTLRWLGDGTHYLLTKRDRQTRRSELLRVNALTGATSPFLDAAAETAFARVPGITAEDARRLAAGDLFDFNPAQTAALVNFKNNLYFYDRAANKAEQLTNDDAEESVETFSPDGKLVAFVRNNDLYVVEVAAKRERRLTTDGSEKIFNGRLNWVYQEELYGRGNFKSFWWSPDSKQLAYLKLDDAPVKSFAVVDHIPRLQEVEMTPYPKAGDSNPLVRLGIVAASGGDTKFVDLRAYQPTDLLISRVAWSPDNRRVIYQAQDRAQTFLDLNAANPANGETRTLLREASKFAKGDTVGSLPARAWVEAIDNASYLRDGSFVWQSDRDGWRHLYHYAGDGKLIRRLTQGEWEVRELYGVDEAKGLIYFSSTAHSHIAPQPYRIKTDGTGLTRLTKTEGTQSADFNSTFSHFIVRASDINTPMQTRLHAADGTLVRTIDENKPTALGEFKLGRTELLQVPTRDGFQMEALMILPPDFDPAKKYPVWSHTYSGPQAPTVRNAWGGATYLWHQMLAQQGYIVWICDNRSASGKGVAPAWTSARAFGAGELRDLEDGINFLKTKPYVDSARIGLWGWSFGGYMTTYAMTNSNLFKIGIAGGSVTDWRLYDSIYTERYMGTPQTNEAGYKATAPLTRAADLNGKLLLIHGMIDDNVHMQNTIQFAYELQKAGKPFQIMLYPKSRHGVVDPLLVKHMRQMMTDFIVNNL